MFGIRRTLTQANIPTPTSILADLLVLRITALQYGDEQYRYHGESISITLKLKDDRTVEIHMSSLYDPSSHRHHDEYLTVGMPGAPKYRSVDLEGSERTRVRDAIYALIKRHQAQRYADAQAESQHNALDIVERLL